jgi:hypothetical protein
MRPIGVLLLALVCPAIPRAAAQSVVSVRSGLINYFEGDVVVDGQRLERKYGTFARLKEGSDLVTRSGRAEVLLTPNTYLRVGEDSSIRMRSDSLSDTRIELLSGSAILDSLKASDAAATHVTLLYQDSEVRILDPGKYRVDAHPAQFRVYQGKAEVADAGKTVQLGPSQLYALGGGSVVQRFTEGSDGLLDLWSQERQLLISSNLSNSQTLTDPLLDPDPGIPAGGLDAYLGYLPPPVTRAPLVTVPPLYSTYSTWGYSGLYGPYGPYGSPYGYGLSALAPIYGAYSVYGGYPVNGTRFGSVYLGRPAVGSIGTIGRSTIGLPQRSVGITPRPGYVPGRPPGAAITPRPVGPAGPRAVTPHATPAIPHR